MRQQEYSTTSSASIALSAMLERELAVHSRRDHLDAASLAACDHSPIAPGDRTSMVDWCYDIVDKCRFARKTVAVAVDMVDRFVPSLPSGGGRGNPQDSQGRLGQDAEDAPYNLRQYHLASLTALYTAIKLNERVAFSSQDVSAASRGAYTAREIEDAEREMLRALEWRLRPTALQVGCEVLELMKERMGAGRGALHFLREELHFQTEIAVRECYFATRRPSTIAVASLLNAIEEVNLADCELLTNALMSVLQEFEFEGGGVMLEVRCILKVLLAQYEGGNDGDDSAVNFEEGTRGVI